MDRLFELVSQHCDIRLLKAGCNFRGCDRKPGSELLVYQMDMATSKKKDMISLYLCPEHYAEMEKLLAEVVERFKAGKTYKIKRPDDKVKITTY